MRIKYTCDKCGKVMEVPASWADMKPFKCMAGKKCKTDFRKNPELLKVEMPEVKKEEPKQVPAKKKKKSEDENSES